MTAIDPSSRIALIIPAYKPESKLFSFVNTLSDLSPGLIIIVIDDGSGPEYQSLFTKCQQLPNITVVHHETNVGKGGALKTGIRHLQTNYSQILGLVTADADGQHTPEDTLRILNTLHKHPLSLVLGSREFNDNVPFRSRLGNTLTRLLVRALIGQTLADTQTGLRGIPLPLAQILLNVPAQKYEFELEMLIVAKHHGYSILEQCIRTIYINNNASSHFNPLLDSMRIYFVLLRFSTLSLLTALLDNLVFFFTYSVTGRIAISQTVSRSAAILFNYRAVRRAVFLSNEPHRIVLPKYLGLVVLSGAASYFLIGIFHRMLSLSVLEAKLISESLLFFVNFSIQRDFIFKRR